MKEDPPPEFLILVCFMIIVFGGTLALNFVVNLFLPGLH